LGRVFRGREKSSGGFFAFSLSPPVRIQGETSALRQALPAGLRLRSTNASAASRRTSFWSCKEEKVKKCWKIRKTYGNLALALAWCKWKHMLDRSVWICCYCFLSYPVAVCFFDAGLIFDGILGVIFERNEFDVVLRIDCFAFYLFV